MWFKGLVEIILGLWLFLSVFAGLRQSAASINDFIVGIVVLSLSLFHTGYEPRQSLIGCILGFWLILAGCIPFLVSGMGLYLHNIILGLIIITIGLMMFIHRKKLAHQAKTVDHYSYRNYGSE
ncbi:MAG: hypothetical protein PVF17_13010 [Ignavibacteria bacterium]|jgi:hypothetical protein